MNFIRRYPFLTEVLDNRLDFKFLHFANVSHLPLLKVLYFFCGSFMFLFCLVFAMFCARLCICALWSPAGKGLTSWLSFVLSSVSLSLSHWYPGSGVVLDCIVSWSLQPYLLLNKRPSMAACFSHSQWHSIRSNDRLTKILNQWISLKHIRLRIFDYKKLRTISNICTSSDHDEIICKISKASA